MLADSFDRNKVFNISREREQFLEMFKIQVNEIILQTGSYLLVGFPCLNIPPFLKISSRAVTNT